MHRIAGVTIAGALVGLLSAPLAAAQGAPNYMGKPASAQPDLGGIDPPAVKHIDPSGAPVTPSADAVVVYQDPLPGVALNPSDPTVTLVVTETVVVPDFSGMKLGTAQKLGASLDLVVVGRDEQGNVHNDPEFLVASNDPTQTAQMKEPGTAVGVGATVGVIVITPGAFSSVVDCTPWILVAAAAGALIAGLLVRSTLQRRIQRLEQEVRRLGGSP